MFFGMWWAIFLTSCYLARDVEGSDYALGRIALAGAIAFVTSGVFAFAVVPSEEHAKKLDRRLWNAETSLNIWAELLSERNEREKKERETKEDAGQTDV